MIGAEWGAGAGFCWESDELRVVLAFADTYEVGISNQALQILYHLASGEPGVAVERAYLPGWTLRRSCAKLVSAC